LRRSAEIDCGVCLKNGYAEEGRASVRLKNDEIVIDHRLGSA
jgi:hypothetical protein